MLFADPGHALFSANDALRAIAISVVVAAIVPVAEIRIGAIVGAALVLVLFLVSTPVGVSSARLTLLFAIPVITAYGAVKGRWVALVVAIAVLAQPPITLGTLRNAGSDATQASFYQPLLDQIAAAGPLTGRVEVPELIGHWEALLRSRPDSDRAGMAAPDRHRAQSRRLLRPTTQCAVLPSLSAADCDAIRRRRRCASHLLCAPGDPADRRRAPYLREVWRSAHWRLYAVDGATAIVSPPGILVAQDAAHITLDAPPGSLLQLRLRWWRWLTLDGEPGACIEQSDLGVALRVGNLSSSTSRYVISSSLTSRSGRGHC